MILDIQNKGSCMQIKKEEILTFEVYQRDGKMMIHLPIANINPKGFSIENNNLYFHLQDKSYFISNLNDRIIKHIRKNNCFIIEDLDHINAKMHLITL